MKEAGLVLHSIIYLHLVQQRLRIGVTLWRRQPEHRRIVPALGAEGGTPGLWV
jgi:hypothetical protein